MVVAEDAHWFDRPPSKVLGSLLDAAEGRLLVVVTGTPRPVAARRLAGDGDRPQAVDRGRDRQPDRRPGSELCRHTIGQRLPTAATGCRSTSSRSSAGSTETGVPEGLYEPLLARLRASANIVPVVEAAALIGRQLDRDLLRSVVDLSDDVLDGVLDELEDARVLEPWGSDGWRFRHELLREVATELAPPSVRRSLHAKSRRRACQRRRWGSRLAAGRRALRAGRRTRRGGLGVSTGIDGCATARRSRRSPRLPDSRPRPVGEQPPGRARDVREMAVRMERGFLASAAEGPLEPRHGGRLRGVPAARRDRRARRRSVRHAARPGRLLLRHWGSAPLRTRC